MEGNPGGEVTLDGVVVTGVALEGVVNIVGRADSVDSEADTFDNPLAAEAIVSDLLAAEVDVLAAPELGECRDDEPEEALADGLALGDVLPGGVGDVLPGGVGDVLPGGGGDGLPGDLDGVAGGGEDDLDEGLLPRINRLVILEPATQSMSKNLARSRTTFPLIWNVPDDTP